MKDLNRQTKIVKVPANGQISIGSNWAGREIRLEITTNEILIQSGTFIPDSQKVFFTSEALDSLEAFNEYESKNPPKKTNNKEIFKKLLEKKSSK